MRSAYRALARAIAVGVVVQAMVIAIGFFTVLHDVDDGASFTKNTDDNAGLVLHGALGSGVIPLLAVALLVVAFFAGIDGGVKWAAFVLAAVVVQVLTAMIASAVPVLGLLHGMNAFILLALSDFAARRARLVEEPRPAAAA